MLKYQYIVGNIGRYYIGMYLQIIYFATYITPLAESFRIAASKSELVLYAILVFVRVYRHNLLKVE